MKQSTHHVVFPASLIVVTMAFITTFCLASAVPSYAASGKAKAAAVSAVDQTEGRIKQLHAALKITEDQNELWNNLTQVMRDNAKDMDTITKGRAESVKTMNAVEHMKLHSQISEAQLAHMKKFIPPFEALYASMSVDQKKITDVLFRTGKQGKHSFK